MAGKESKLQSMRVLENFPAAVLADIQSVFENGGALSHERCQSVMDALGISAGVLMQRLLPLTGLYASAQISGSQVGAVVNAAMSPDDSDVALFLGANIEFPGQSLAQTIHAEQAAVVNAWLAGAGQIDSIAVTATPCGYCRQFLYELKNCRNLNILLCDQRGGRTTRRRLTNLLPAAFGPHDLGHEGGLMGPPHPAIRLKLDGSAEDPVVFEALSAASKSYAPYSGNFAGCVIETTEGKMYAGRYAENAAFNPSVSPLQAAFIQMTMDTPGGQKKIRRAVLVEIPTAISQRTICELHLNPIGPDVTLEYVEARVG
jgi:cytidine deaminase